MVMNMGVIELSSSIFELQLDWIWIFGLELDSIFFFELIELDSIKLDFKLKENINLLKIIQLGSIHLEY